VALYLKLMASTFVATTLRYNLGIYVRTGARARVDTACSLFAAFVCVLRWLTCIRLAATQTRP
jgi:hypothetical protein